MKVILLTYANNESEYLPELRNEIETIDTYLTSFIDDGIATPQSKDLPDAESLLKLIDIYKKNLSIFLFSGHASSKSILIGDGNELYGEGLAKKLNIKECPNLKLVFLNGCSTIGMVNQLIDNSVPVIIYTYSPIDDKKAAAFSMTFFKALADGQSIEHAFGKAKGDINFLTNGKKNIIDRSIVKRKLGYKTDDVEIDENNWGCVHTDGMVFREWTISNSNEESIRIEDFENLIRTEKDTPEYKRLELLRQILTDLEKNKGQIHNDPKQILEIESLCLHIENEIKNNIALSHDIRAEDLYTINKKVRYSLKNSIGFGRYSDIYKAVRIEGDNVKTVAFKVLKMNLYSDLELLKNKIYHLRTLPNDKHLVKTIVDSFGTNFPYYVTEYIDKSNLRNFIIKHKATGNELLELIKQIINPVCDALHHLHYEEKYAHMDVRPSNIVIKNNYKKIEDVVLIDLDDYVTSDDKEHKSYLKSSPYLDPKIREDIKNKIFNINNCYQADIYSLTLVFLFCIVKEDLMDQTMVKRLHQEEGLKNYIKDLQVSEEVKSFLRKGTRIDGDKFEDILEFKESLNEIKSVELPELPVPPEPNWLQKHMKEILIGFGVITLISLSYGFYTYRNESTILSAKNNDLIELQKESNSIERKLFQLQNWHLQLPLEKIREQIPYIDDRNSHFFKKINDIVELIRKTDYGITRNNKVSLDSTYIVNDENFDEMKKDTNKIRYHGIQGDDTTWYFPRYGRISVTNNAKKIETAEDFNESSKRIINELIEYLINNSSEFIGSEKDSTERMNFLNNYLIGKNKNGINIDSLHLITLMYLGYEEHNEVNGKKTSFMLRYPAYNVPIDKDKGNEVRYPLTKRPWWVKSESSDSVKRLNEAHGFTTSYEDKRTNMPQPRTFWYRIPLHHPEATAVLGIDFVFKPIDNPEGKK